MSGEWRENDATRASPLKTCDVTNATRKTVANDKCQTMPSTSTKPRDKSWETRTHKDRQSETACSSQQSKLMFSDKSHLLSVYQKTMRDCKVWSLNLLPQHVSLALDIFHLNCCTDLFSGAGATCHVVCFEALSCPPGSASRLKSDLALASSVVLKSSKSCREFKLWQLTSSSTKEQGFNPATSRQKLFL